MWELALYLALGEPNDPDRIAQTSAVVVGVYDTLEECDTARWQWWRSARVPKDWNGWVQFTPASCEARAVTS